MLTSLQAGVPRCTALTGVLKRIRSLRAKRGLPCLMSSSEEHVNVYWETPLGSPSSSAVSWKNSSVAKELCLITCSCSQWLRASLQILLPSQARSRCCALAPTASRTGFSRCFLWSKTHRETQLYSCNEDNYTVVIVEGFDYYLLQEATLMHWKFKPCQGSV